MFLNNWKVIITFTIRARPKSATLQMLLAPTKTFRAARSLWMLFCSSRYAIPSATWFAISISVRASRSRPSSPMKGKLKESCLSASGLCTRLTLRKGVYIEVCSVEESLLLKYNALQYCVTLPKK